MAYERSQPSPASIVEEAAGITPEQQNHIDAHFAKQRTEEDKKSLDRTVNEKLLYDEAERLTEEERQKLRRIVTRKASGVQIRRTRWLWRDRVPLGGLALLAGKGDTSKSTLFACFAAWLTIGAMKGEFWEQPQNVLYVVNEDSIEETVVPRMMAHGADLDRIDFLAVQSPVGKDALMLPRDADLLRAKIRETNAVATFIDPLSANVTGRPNDSKDTRNTYQVVNSIAEETMTSIFGLAHTRKAGAADIMEGILGSSEQGNVARSVHGLVMDPDEDGARILSCEKLNVGQKHALPGLRFTVESVDVPISSYESTPMPGIKWLAETTDTASGVLEDAMFGNSGTADCARWLLDLLHRNGGQMYHSDVVQEGGKKYSSSMLMRAKKTAGVTSRRVPEVPPRSVWYHPDNQSL